MAIVGFSNLCEPAQLYLVVSMLALVIMLYQNFGNSNMYCVGSYSCQISSTMMIFVVKLIYILFWTWILNLICRSGSPMISWLLVLVPFLILFIFIGTVFTYNVATIPNQYFASSSYL